MVPESTVEFGLGGVPDALIAVLLHAGSARGNVVRQMAEGVRYALTTHEWRAGDSRVGIVWHVPHAHEVGSDERVLAVLGPFRSPETTHVLSELNQAGLAVVSASNTYVPLTGHGPAYEADEPECYAPSGTRSFVRLFPNDYHQAAAIAQLVGGENRRRLYVLHDGEVYGRAVAEGLQRAASAAGLEVSGYDCWRDFEDHSTNMRLRLDGSEADALALCGVADNYSVRLLHYAAGAVDPRMRVFCADGLLQNGGTRGWPAGTVAVAPGIRRPYLPAAAEATAVALSDRLGIKPSQLEPYALHACEATDLLLWAIGTGKQSRTGVVSALFEKHGHHGLLGSYWIGERGDVVSEDGVVGFSVYRTVAGGEFRLSGAVVPAIKLVAAAYG